MGIFLITNSLISHFQKRLLVAFTMMTLATGAALANDKVTVQVQALKADGAPPAMILLPEQMRRLNDMGALMEQRLPGLPDSHGLLVNKRHPLVEGMLKLLGMQLVLMPTWHQRLLKKKLVLQSLPDELYLY